MCNVQKFRQGDHSEHFDCHSERSEESQGKFREESKVEILRCTQDDLNLVFFLDFL